MRKGTQHAKGHRRRSTNGHTDHAKGHERRSTKGHAESTRRVTGAKGHGSEGSRAAFDGKGRVKGQARGEEGAHGGEFSAGAA
mmetsp:Transcript_6380/g.12636  ORF Transcript_6380/g.12636 Transcript_6380/m.12636 type:complete len:83 (-) Transcript_6380:149-397(-)